jgi:hypothetical protein
MIRRIDKALRFIPVLFVTSLVIFCPLAFIFSRAFDSLPDGLFLAGLALIGVATFLVAMILYRYTLHPFHASRCKKLLKLKCPNCNYDTRFTPKQCPECGRILGDESEQDEADCADRT